MLIVPFAVGGANSALVSAMASILYLLWAAFAFGTVPLEAVLLRPLYPVAIPLLLLLLWTAAPIYSAIAPRVILAPLDPDLLGIAWCHAAALVALLLGCGVAGRLRGFVRAAVTALCVGAAVLIVGTLALRSFGGPALLASIVIEQRNHRFAGLIGNANAAGISFGMISLLMSGVARDRWERWRDRPHPRPHPLLVASIALIGAIVALVLVALTQSRAAFGATMLALGGYAVLPGPGARQRPASRRHQAAAVLAVSIGAAAASLAATSVLERYSVVNQDGSGRVEILEYYTRLALDAPLFGYGLGGFAAFNQQRLTPDTVLRVGDFGAAHNALLQLAIEAGWPAVALLLVALIGIGVRVARAPGVVQAPIPRAMLFAVAIAVVGSMVDIALNVPAIAALSAALLGLVWGRALGETTVAPTLEPGVRQRDAALVAPWPMSDSRN